MIIFKGNFLRTAQLIIYIVLTVLFRDVENNSTSAIHHVAPKVALLSPLHSGRGMAQIFKILWFFTL